MDAFIDIFTQEYTAHVPNAVIAESLYGYIKPAKHSCL